MDMKEDDIRKYFRKKEVMKDGNRDEWQASFSNSGITMKIIAGDFTDSVPEKMLDDIYDYNILEVGLWEEVSGKRIGESFLINTEDAYNMIVDFVDRGLIPFEAKIWEEKRFSVGDVVYDDDGHKEEEQKEWYSHGDKEFEKLLTYEYKGKLINTDQYNLLSDSEKKKAIKLDIEEEEIKERYDESYEIIKKIIEDTYPSGSVRAVHKLFDSLLACGMGPVAGVLDLKNKEALQHVLADQDAMYNLCELRRETK